MSAQLDAAPPVKARLAPLAAVLRRRALQAVGVVLLVSTACFAIVQSLPGDIAFRIAAGRYGYDAVTASSAAAVRADLGLDQPAWQQLFGWWADVARLDLGKSLVTNADVGDELGLSLAASLQLAAAALLLACAFGTAAGAFAARHPGGLVDRATDAGVTLARAFPPFLLGLALILVFSVHLGVLPAAGHGDGGSIILPALTLAIGLAALFARVSRDTIAGILASDYVGFARTKGLSARLVYLRHVLRNAGVTLIAYLGVQALILIEGVVVIESLFGWPGLGHALVHAVFWRDLPMIQASALALALLVVAINTAADLAGLAADPRPRNRKAFQ